MPKRTTIRQKAGRRLFNMRIAGLAFRNGHVLVHRATHEKFWTFPGGTAEIGESSLGTLEREMLEELGQTVTIGRLLWSVENFFRFEGRKWHEIDYYYLMDLPETFPFMSGTIVHSIRDGDNSLEFQWVPANAEALAALPLQPDFIPTRIHALPATCEHLIHHEDVPE